MSGGGAPGRVERQGRPRASRAATGILPDDHYRVVRLPSMLAANTGAGESDAACRDRITVYNLSYCESVQDPLQCKS